MEMLYHSLCSLSAALSSLLSELPQCVYQTCGLCYANSRYRIYKSSSLYLVEQTQVLFLYLMYRQYSIGRDAQSL